MVGETYANVIADNELVVFQFAIEHVDPGTATLCSPRQSQQPQHRRVVSTVLMEGTGKGKERAQQQQQQQPSTSVGDRVLPKLKVKAGTAIAKVRFTRHNGVVSFKTRGGKLADEGGGLGVDGVQGPPDAGAPGREDCLHYGRFVCCRQVVGISSLSSVINAPDSIVSGLME